MTEIEQVVTETTKSTKVLDTNEVRVSMKAPIGRLIAESISKVSAAEVGQSVILTGLGNAIPKLIEVIEAVKRKIGFLHQLNELTYLTLGQGEDDDNEELKESDKKKRGVEQLKIVLSKNALDKNSVGYQKPAPISGRAKFFKRNFNNKPENSDSDKAVREENPKKQTGPRPQTQKLQKPGPEGQVSQGAFHQRARPDQKQQRVQTARPQQQEQQHLAQTDRPQQQEQQQRSQNGRPKQQEQ